MRRDPHAKYDGLTTIGKGVHSGAAPIAIARDQLAWATNIDARTSFLRPRPGWMRRVLTFLNSAGVPDPTVESNFQTGIFQGSIVFERLSLIVCMIGGRLFRIDPALWTVTDVTPPDGPNANDKYRAWFCEVEDWVIAQDGISIPMIFDGASTVRSDTLGANGKPQVPIGKAMVYAQNRLIVGYANGREFVVGDICGGSSGTAAYGFRDAVLYFTENAIINGGGSFTIPINAGFITAFRPVAQVDTSTGQGPTQVFTTGGIFSLNTSNDRTTWFDTTAPIGTVSNVNNGSLSDRATVNVNGDIWFRALDGVRSFVVARRDFTTWVNAPLSHEESRAIDGDDRNLLDYASAAAFDNKLLMTTRPYRKWGHGIAHQALMPLDFEPVTAITERGSTPTWMGLNTGLQHLQVLTGVIRKIQRCFAFTLSPTNTIQLWECSTTRTSDAGSDADSPIEWTWETAAFPFTSDSLPGREMLSLDGGRLYVDEIEGDVSFSFQYRTDQDPCWHDWHSWSVCATDADCDVGETCGPPGTLRRQYRKPFNLPTPSGCDSTVDKRLNWGREFQVRASITGYCRVKMLELLTHEQQENVTAVCAPTETCRALSCCPPDDYSYAIPPGADPPTPPVPPDPPAPPAEGACCIGGVCYIRSEAACLAAGGVYHGDLTECAEETCPSTPDPEATGACCIDGVCSVTTQALCIAAGGTYLGDDTTCDASPCASSPEYPGDPTWPTPTPLPCEGLASFGPTIVTDPSTGIDQYVGINPGAADPGTYLEGLSPGATTAWAHDVWSQFLAAAIPFSTARLEWANAPTTNQAYQGWSVYPAQAGGYFSAINLDTKIVVYYCPA